MVEKDNRQRLSINFKNNDLETKMYNYIKSIELDTHSSYVKKLIYEDMKKKGLL